MTTNASWTRRIALIAALATWACSGDDPADPTDTGGADLAPPDATSGDTPVDVEVTTPPDTTIEPEVFDPDLPPLVEECVITDGSEPDFLQRIGCTADFDTVASAPLDASIPGATSAKTVIDRVDDLAVYFQNSKKYLIHHDFASAHLSGNGLPIVKPLGDFNQTEYYSPNRRFLLGAVTYYEEPGYWVYEIAPYDTSTAEMIQQGYEVIEANAFFGPALFFHPTSAAIQREAAKLPPSVRVITTKQLFGAITFQPLNLGTSTGLLRFMTATELLAGPPHFRELVVLDHVPNDIAVVAGIITAELQTPLSHINVLSQNRGTPNMALVGAFENEPLRALDGKWVELTVGAFEWDIREVTPAEAEAWWEANKPEPVGVPKLDLSVTALTDIEDVLDLETLDLGPAVAQAVPAFGGKASHYAGFHEMGAEFNVPKAFAIPVFYYRQHMEQHGLDADVQAMLDDPDFTADPKVRQVRLAQLQAAIEAAPIDPDFYALVLDKMTTDYPGVRMRFRSSTNAEDLGGFTGAGLYTSKSGDLADPDRPPRNAIRGVWASIWNYKAFEERSYRSIDHQGVGMALLCHRSFPDEDANGVALTANIFDSTGLEPAFYVNVQAGEASVVLPDPGVTTDQFIYYYYYPGQPITFLSSSNLIAEGETVLTAAQTYALGQALDQIHLYWRPLYGADLSKFYAMDVEFKFDTAPGASEPELWVKQARPHPGWGL